MVSIHIDYHLIVHCTDSCQFLRTVFYIPVDQLISFLLFFTFLFHRHLLVTKYVSFFHSAKHFQDLSRFDCSFAVFSLLIQRFFPLFIVGGCKLQLIETKCDEKNRKMSNRLFIHIPSLFIFAYSLS